MWAAAFGDGIDESRGGVVYNDNRIWKAQNPGRGWAADDALNYSLVGCHGGHGSFDPPLLALSQGLPRVPAGETYTAISPKERWSCTLFSTGPRDLTDVKSEPWLPLGAFDHVSRR
ncbi:hypothetical protein JCM33374_g6651 [Metschnikowia sp. JCM 33374]|nr:hypothetical protein JCM33374_g6651 [Metschnikowia sp. JCM 33374]